MARIVITGAPGAGKTTLLGALAAAGYPTVGESARTIIAERRSRGESPRPELSVFAREILWRDIEKHEGAKQDQSWTFFDCGVVEAIGYLHEVSPLPEPELEELLASYRMYPMGFILPPWPEIYCTDAERDQTFDDALRVHQSLVRWYGACGYHLHEVPPGTVADRAAHVLQTLARAMG